jgi:hypothetical protein
MGARSTRLPAGTVLILYGPPRDCKRKAWARRQVCANVFGLQWRSVLLARMSCARVCPYKSVGCSFETIFGIRLRTRCCDCSFVLAALYRPRWVRISRRSSSVGKWERVSASKPQASFPHYFIRQPRSLSADSLVHSTAQPTRSARACSPSQPQQRSWELWRPVRPARLRSVLGRA